MSMFGSEEVGTVWIKKKRTRSHVSCDMLRTSEGSVADGAFVVASH